MSKIPTDRNGQASTPSDNGAGQEDNQSSDFGRQPAPTSATFDDPTGDDSVSNPVIINR